MTSLPPLKATGGNQDDGDLGLPSRLAKLREPFPAEVVGILPKPRRKEDQDKAVCDVCHTFVAKDHIHLDFVGHAAVTDRLLNVDPEWTWEPLALDEHGLPAYDGAGNLWIRLTVCGITRIGVGDGDTAKVKIGDAIRNASMRFGVALYLWSKDELESLVGNETVGKSRKRNPPRSSTPTSGKPPARASRAQDPSTDDGQAPMSARDRNKVISHFARSVSPPIVGDAVDAEVSRLLGEKIALVKLSHIQGARIMFQLGLGPEPEGARLGREDQALNSDPAALPFNLPVETPEARDERVARELAVMEGQSDEPF